jgi:dienelactone hydrolase
MDFVGRHSKEIRGPQMFELARELKTRHPKVGAVGYCYGGWAVFQLGANGNHLVDCISTAHPSFLTTREIEDSSVPVQIIAPENDHQLTPELREFCNKTIPALGLHYAYEFFPGLGHGFAIRGDPSDPVQKKGFERAKSAVVYWLGQHLH